MTEASSGLPGGSREWPASSRHQFDLTPFYNGVCIRDSTADIGERIDNLDSAAMSLRIHGSGGTVIVHMSDDCHIARVHLTIMSEAPDPTDVANAWLVVETSVHVVSGTLEVSGQPGFERETFTVPIPAGAYRVRLRFVPAEDWIRVPSSVLPGEIDVIEPVWVTLWPGPPELPVVVVDHRHMPSQATG